MAASEITGNAQVCPKLLAHCLSLQAYWESTQEGAVVLDNGVLFASHEAWNRHLQSLCNLDVVARRSYPQLRWAKGQAAEIRKLLADADAIRRDHEKRQLMAPDAQSMAKQALLDIVVDALSMKATDIHLRMTGQEARIAYRIDGQLYAQASRSRTSVTEAVAAALNTQSEDFREVFDERQVSGASLTLVLPDSGDSVRIRSQKSPTRDGFSVTLRLQRSEQRELPDLRELGFQQQRIEALGRIMAQATGLLLISGPTGHGKTTTLAALNRTVPHTRKIISLEDPVEIIQPRVEQKFVPTDQDANAFAQMIKTVLREDPDLVEVSEIRDLQTASAGISAALTGHLVVSTIHANDALGIVSRLLDLGLSAHQLSQPSLFAGLLAQRLVPRLCTHCRQPKRDAVWGDTYRRSQQGCEHCSYTGLFGRIAVSELVCPDYHSAQWIRDQNFHAWLVALQQQGWRSMANEAIELIRAGLVDPAIVAELVPGLDIVQQSVIQDTVL
ncbi:MAG: Flp pilus assembly complex ATPase component TadA [Idiomarina sp.]|nr:Flp pilus assembly complex ATPase component TadA [Idiomarina sp.]